MAEGKFQCNSCGREVGSADGFCASCGAQAPGAPPAESGVVDPSLALMTANVFRLRREWALAEAKCSEVLRQDPENAAAHSLMGDILRDQRRYQDAIEWYKLALDKSPANDTNRRKLEAVIDHVFAGEPVRPLEAARSWVGKWRGQTEAGRPVCPWTMLTAGVFAVTLLVAFSLVVLAKRAGPSTTDLSGPRRPPSVDNGMSVPTYRWTQAEPPEEIAGDIAQIEQSTLEQVRRREAQTDPNCRVDAVEIDPKQATAQVVISMPAQWTPADARRAMLRAALVAASTAAADARFAAVRVRCTSRPPTGSEQLALVAEGKADNLRRGTEEGQPQAPEDAFHLVWWSASLQEGGATNAPGGP